MSGRDWLDEEHGGRDNARRVGEGSNDEGSRRVLLVEDDPVSLKLMRDVLQVHGFETEEATNALDALRLAVANPVHLVVMDIGLPGLDGVETTRRLKSQDATREVPVLAVTAYAMPADEERMRQAGCDAYLTKPLDFAEFLSMVNRLAGPVAADAYPESEAGTEK